VVAGPFARMEGSSKAAHLRGKEMNAARKALYDLYLQALGNDYANEHETRGWFGLVDDMLDKVEECARAGCPRATELCSKEQEK